MKSFRYSNKFDDEASKKYNKAKAALWSNLQEYQTGFNIRQDFLIDGYRVDFGCNDLRLAIVIDFDPDVKPINFESSKYWSFLHFKSNDILDQSGFGAIYQEIVRKCEEQAVKFNNGDDLLYVRPYTKNRDKTPKHPELRVYIGAIDGTDKHIFGFGFVSTINVTENMEISMCKEVLANGYKIDLDKFIIHNHIDYTNHSFLPDDICPMCEYVFNETVTNDYLKGEE